MTDLADLQAAARLTVNDNGQEIVELPRELWETFLEEQRPQIQPKSQRDEILELIATWEKDDTPPGWGDEFRKFLKENRLNFEARDLRLKEE